LSKALGVAFDTNVGHDYIEDVEKVMSSTMKKKSVYL
jgi:hypothetical protein